MTTNGFTEAPASVNFKFCFNGYDSMLTLRAETGLELLEKLPAVISKLEAMGAAPNGRKAQPGSNGSAPQAGGPVCPYHGPMKPSTKAPGTFYCTAKMGDGSYCKEKSK